MLSVVNFFKGPVGMAVMGSLITVGTAVTGVTAGPSVAKALTERVNATPASERRTAPHRQTPRLPRTRPLPQAAGRRRTGPPRVQRQLRGRRQYQPGRAQPARRP